MFSTTSTSYNKPQCKWHWNGSLLMVTWPELLLGSYKLYLLVAYLSSTCSGFQPGWCKTWSFRERQSEVTPVASTNTKYGLTNTNGSDILDIFILDFGYNYSVACTHISLSIGVSFRCWFVCFYPTGMEQTLVSLHKVSRAI